MVISGEYSVNLKASFLIPRTFHAKISKDQLNIWKEGQGKQLHFLDIEIHSLEVSGKDTTTYLPPQILQLFSPPQRSSKVHFLPVSPVSQT